MAQEIVIHLDNGMVAGFTRVEGIGVLLQIGELGKSDPFVVTFTVDDSIAIRSAMQHFE
jgi:hypothetical protein